MNLAFWNGKTVLVTGHTGFKGSWLCTWLSELGARVVGLSLPAPTEPNMYTAAAVASRMTSLEGDVRDIDSVRAVVEAHRPEIVFHLAAQALVRLSYEDPVMTFATNVMGTVHTLQAIAECPSVKAAVIVTSDKCYENREWHWGYREIDPMGGADPYSSSKGCAELVTAAYRQSLSFVQPQPGRPPLRIATARAGNVIGGGDWATDRLVPDAVRAFVAGETLVVRSPRALRPWQHVLEPLRGYLMLAESMWDKGDNFGGAWNFGPRDHDTETVGRVVDRLVALWGEGATWRVDVGENPPEATHLKLDCSKARLQLGWHPLVGLDTALEWSVEWYQAYARQGRAQVMTLDQIRRYQELARIQDSAL